MYSVSVVTHDELPKLLSSLILLSLSLLTMNEMWLWSWNWVSCLLLLAFCLFVCCCCCFGFFLLLKSHSFGWPYVCLRQSRLVIGQFGFSGLPPSDAKPRKGKPTIESERKNISTWDNFFNSWSKSCETFRFWSLQCCLSLCFDWNWKLGRNGH